MKAKVFQALSLMTLLLLSLEASAQLDSSMLLHPSGHTPSKSHLDSTRYKVRSPESRKIQESSADEEQPGTYIASPVPKVKEAKASAPVEAPAPQPAPQPAPEPAAVAPQPAPQPEVVVRDEHPPVTVQVRELILGGSDEDIDVAKRQIHPEDPRANMLSISLAPAYFYNGSSSNYSFHNYHSDGPGMGLGVNLWLTPFFGFQSKYFTSVSSSVRDGANVVPMTAQSFDAGFRFRKHFGYTRKSAQLSWGLDYHDNSEKISKEATATVGGKTSGISINLEGEIPTSVTYSHLFEVGIRPSQHHSETATTSAPQSGTKCETNSVSFSLGGQWTLDRRNQVFWKTQYSVERNLYSGSANLPDPTTGVTPNGVSTTNSMAIFYFGFKWGS